MSENDGLLGGLKESEAKTRQDQEDRDRAKEALRERRQGKKFAELRTLNRQLVDALEASERTAELLLAFDDATEPHVIKMPKKKAAKNPTTTISMLSDLHCEEVVELALTNGYNEHNLQMSEEKLDKYWRNTVELIRMTEPKCKIVEHILWLGGDLMTGHIQEEFPEITELSPIDTVLWLYPRLTAGIQFMRDQLDVPKITVVCNYGNHGRTTLRPRVHTAARHSYEYLLYQVLQKDFKKVSGVEFRVPASLMYYIELPGFTIRTTHMDLIRYHGGIGGLHIPLNRKIVKWNEAKHADLTLGGHWHQKLDLEYAVINGSCIGYSPFSIKIGAPPEPPRQVFLMIDMERRAKTGVFPIWVK